MDYAHSIDTDADSHEDEMTNPSLDSTQDDVAGDGSSINSYIAPFQSDVFVAKENDSLGHSASQASHGSAVDRTSRKDIIAYRSIADQFTLVQETLDTDFRKEFPPDPRIGGEMDEAARVWKVYRKEAEAFDNGLLEGWSATLDILLIFAGLFSAVATAFVIESYQLLQPDNAAYTAVALYILVTASNHTTGISLPPPPELGYKSPLSRWINGLWFTSILLSLSVALLSILAKQWITEYRARNRASARSPRDWARRREVYFQALTSWPVAEVVSVLPFLLHLSLFLFFAGVVGFLWTVDGAIGIWIVVLGVLLAIFYLGCTFLPLWIPECPTSTPLVHLMRTGALTLVVTCAYACQRACLFTLTLRAATAAFIIRCIRRVKPAMRPVRMSPPEVLPFPLQLSDSESVRSVISAPSYLKTVIRRAEALRREERGISHRIHETRHLLDASGLQWLITAVSDSDAVAVAYQALGALHPASASAAMLRDHYLVAIVPEDAAFTRSATGHSPAEVLRYMRSRLCMTGFPSSGAMSYDSKQRILRLLHGTGNTAYPDLALLSSLCSDVDDADLWLTQAVSPSLQSTAVQAIRVFASRNWDPMFFLFCCDFASFSSNDWDIALQAVLAWGDYFPWDAVEPVHFPEGLKHLGLAAGLARVSRRMWRLDHERQELANRLIVRILSVVPSGLPRSLPLHELAFRLLLEFVDSYRLYVRAIQPDLSFLVAQLPYWAASETVKTRSAMERFWRVLVFVCDGSRIASPTSLVDFRVFILANVNTLMNCVRDACTVVLSVNSTSVEHLSVALNYILRPIASTDVTLSLWEILSARRYPAMVWALTHRVLLAEALASALCICVRDGMIVTELQREESVDAYFKELTIDLIYEGDQARIIHLVRHCVEIRPQWWHDARREALGKEEKSAHLLAIDDEVNRLGQCKKCVARAPTL